MKKNRVTVSEMSSNRLYVDLETKSLYRRLESGILEKRIKNNWITVKINSQIILELKLREY